MRVDWYAANIYKSQCTGIVNPATTLSYTTLKTALFDGIFPPKRCGTVKPHRDFSGWVV